MVIVYTKSSFSDSFFYTKSRLRHSNPRGIRSKKCDRTLKIRWKNYGGLAIIRWEKCEHALHHVRQDTINHLVLAIRPNIPTSILEKRTKTPEMALEKRSLVAGAEPTSLFKMSAAFQSGTLATMAGTL